MGPSSVSKFRIVRRAAASAALLAVLGLLAAACGGDSDG